MEIRGRRRNLAESGTVNGARISEIRTNDGQLLKIPQSGVLSCLPPSYRQFPACGILVEAFVAAFVGAFVGAFGAGNGIRIN